MFSLSNLRICPSRTLLIVYVGVHLLALVVSTILALDLFTRFILILFVLFSFGLNLREQILLSSAQSIVGLSWDTESKLLKLRQRDGAELDVDALKRRWLLPFAVCLLCKVSGRLFPVPVFIMWDACSVSDFRRLRVLLLHAQVVEPAS